MRLSLQSPVCHFKEGEMNHGNASQKKLLLFYPKNLGRGLFLKGAREDCPRLWYKEMLAGTGYCKFVTMFCFFCFCENLVVLV